MAVEAQGAGTTAFGIDDQPRFAGEHDMADIGAAQVERLQSGSLYLAESI